MTTRLRSLRTALIVSLAASLSLGAAACDKSTGPVHIYDGPLRIVPRFPDLLMENRTTETIYYFAVEQDTAAKVTWVPCDDPNTCVHDSIGAGQFHRVSYGRITGYTLNDRVAIVYYWVLLSKPDGGRQVSTVWNHVIKL
jgi:hypothetical protein